MPLPRSRPLSPTERGNAMLNQNIVREATRLTRTGQLVEATALLQRMLRGESPAEHFESTTAAAPARLEPPTIDVKADVVEEKESQQTTWPLLCSGAPASRRWTACVGSRGSACVVRCCALRPPLPISRPTERNSSKALSVAPPEAEPTSYSSQAALKESRFRWWSCSTAVRSRRTISRPAPA